MTSPFPTGPVPVQQFGILRIGRSWRLRDLSGRGTDVRSELVKQARLVNGTTIRVSRWYAIFEVDATDENWAGREVGYRRTDGTL
jgi:hypothetical protein